MKLKFSEMFKNGIIHLFLYGAFRKKSKKSWNYQEWRPY